MIQVKLSLQNSHSLKICKKFKPKLKSLVQCLIKSSEVNLKRQMKN